MTDKEQPVEAKPRIPGWAWLFIVACGIIPFITLGGAIPGAIGGGGAFGCLAVARDPTKPVGVRVGICIGITVVCWGLLAALLIGAAFAQA